MVFFTQGLSGNLKLFIFTGTARFELATFGVVAGLLIQQPRIPGCCHTLCLDSVSPLVGDDADSKHKKTESKQNGR